MPSWQAWYKPLPNRSAALFVANHDADAAANVTIDFSEVPGLGGGQYAVADVWTQEPLAGARTSHSAPRLAPRDSVFITVHPVSQPEPVELGLDA